MAVPSQKKLDHYCRVLGLHYDPSQDEIKAAYKALALQWHPDRHKSDKEYAKDKFIKIHAAYEALLLVRSDLPPRSSSSSSSSSPSFQASSFYSQSANGSTSSQTSFTPSSPSPSPRDDLDDPTPKADKRFKPKKSHHPGGSHSSPNSHHSENGHHSRARRPEKAYYSEKSDHHSDRRDHHPYSKSHRHRYHEQHEHHEHHHHHRHHHNKDDRPHSDNGAGVDDEDEATSAPETEPASETKLKPEPEPEPEPKVKPEPEPEPEPKVGQDPELDSDQTPPVIGFPLRPSRAPGTENSDWIFSLPLTLEELYSGTSYQFQISRKVNSSDSTEASELNTGAQNVASPTVQIHLEIPSGGYKNGAQIRFEGLGNQRRTDGSFQDIVFLVQQTIHDRFSRIKNDLIARIELLWDEESFKADDLIMIEGLDGDNIAVPVPASPDQDRETRIPKAGMPIRNSEGRTIGRGDLVVRWEFVFPEKRCPKTKWQGLKSAFTWQQHKPVV